MKKSRLKGGFYDGKRSKALTVAAQPESKIQRAICDFLDLRNVVYAVTDAKTVQTVNGERQCVRPEGWPDLTVILPFTGRLWGIEVKSESGRMREAQVDMRALIEASGGLFTEARDSLVIQKILDEHLAQYKTSVLISYMDVIKGLKRAFSEHAFARKLKSKRRRAAKEVEAQAKLNSIIEELSQTSDAPLPSPSATNG